MREGIPGGMKMKEGVMEEIRMSEIVEEAMVSRKETRERMPMPENGLTLGFDSAKCARWRKTREGGKW
jgi:hypothetical protein